MTEPTTCCRADGNYCTRCDLLIGLNGLRVIGVERRERDGLTVTVESPPGPVGCPGCGVLATGHGRAPVPLVDAPAMGRPVRLLWRKRRWRCLEPACPVVTFLEQDQAVAAPRSKLTTRAAWWAIEQIRREHASVNGIRRQLSTSWRTVWETIRPLLEAAEQKPARFDGVAILGVDEHVWHHVSTLPIGAGGRGPKELTGMVDLSRDAAGRTRARLLDLVPGRSGEAYRAWLQDRGSGFRDRVESARLDPFLGNKNAIDDQLGDVRAVPDDFQLVQLGTKVVDDVRRRVQQQIHNHRGRKGDPLYGIRNLLRAGEEHLTDRQRTRLERAWAADERHVAVEVAWHCAQQLRSCYHQASHREGRVIAERVLESFSSCPIPEVARLGRTLRTWGDEFLGYFDTGGANNGGTEAVNGLIELHRRIARGFRNRDNYRLRMLLIGGGLLA